MDSIPLEVVYKNMYSEYPEILEVKDLCEILGYGKKRFISLSRKDNSKKFLVVEQSRSQKLRL